MSSLSLIGITGKRPLGYESHNLSIFNKVENTDGTPNRCKEAYSLINDKKDLSNPFKHLCYKQYQHVVALFGPSNCRRFFLREPPNQVDCGTLEIRPAAKSLLGTPAYCTGVFRVYLGPTVQAFALLPAAGRFPSCSRGEAAFQGRTVPDAGNVCLYSDQTCN